MYNEVQKQAFINSIPTTERSATKTFILKMFKWFENYEVLWGKDLSLQTTEVLQPVINRFPKMKYQNSTFVLMLLQDYTRWSAENGYEVSDGIFGVNAQQADQTRIQMISSPSHLKQIMDKKVVEVDGRTVICGFDPPEEETIDITYRVFLWMAFAGLQDKDAIRVTLNHINLKKMHINFEGYLYPIYQESKVDFEKACCLKDFNYTHPLYAKRRRARCDGDAIMRGFRSNTVDFTTIRPIIYKRLSFRSPMKEKITYNKILLSGICYRAYEREKLGFPVDFSDIIARELQEKNYTQNEHRTPLVIAGKRERDYVSYYNKWKYAFIQQDERIIY